MADPNSIGSATVLFSLDEASVLSLVPHSYFSPRDSQENYLQISPWNFGIAAKNLNPLRNS